MAEKIKSEKTLFKGVQERISRWLKDYDFVSQIQDFFLLDGAQKVSAGTTIAVDLSDFSKSFGGSQMEGAERGYDGSEEFFDYELTRIKTNFLMLRGNALFAPLVAKIKLVPSRVAQYRVLECARERVPARFLFLLSKRKSFLCYYRRA